MIKKHNERLAQSAAAMCALLACAIAIVPAAAQSSAPAAAPAAATAYVRTILVSDLPGARTTDPKLVEPRGVSFVPGNEFWVSTSVGVATEYDGAGAKVPMIVTIPAPSSAPPGAKSSPTGQIANTTWEFPVQWSGLSASVLFATEDGTIAAWGGAPYESGAAASGRKAETFEFSAEIVVDNSASHANYKGLAIGSSPNGNFLYATNFYAARIDVFDGRFRRVALPAAAFKDPALPKGYAPFGIANIDGDLFVSYARQDAAKHDDAPWKGRGVVNVFDTSGKLLRRFATGGPLNSPWGFAASPIGFGTYGGKILVGNFGDGRINVFERSGAFVGQLGNAGQTPFTIPGLWAITFGGGLKSSPDTLFYSAGANGEGHGQFGSIAPN